MTSKRFSAVLSLAVATLLYVLMATVSLAQPADQLQSSKAERERLIQENETAKKKEQDERAGKVKKLEVKAGDLQKRLERIRRARNAKAETLEKYETDLKAANDQIESIKSQLTELDQTFEQKRRRVLLAHKLPGDPPLYERDGKILVESEIEQVRAEENRPQATPEQIAQARNALAKARRALAERDLPAAHAAVKEAERAAGAGNLEELIAPTASLVQCLEEFWRVVDGALPALAGSELHVADTIVFVVEAQPDHVVIRAAGGNRTYTRKTLPSSVARVVAEGSLEKSATSKAIFGAFLAVDPKMAANGGRERAKALWKEAAAGGVDVKALQKSLDAP